jgi:hypothetical protein
MMVSQHERYYFAQERRLERGAKIKCWNAKNKTVFAWIGDLFLYE